MVVWHVDTKRLKTKLLLEESTVVNVKLKYEIKINFKEATKVKEAIRGTSELDIHDKEYA